MLVVLPYTEVLALSLAQRLRMLVQSLVLAAQATRFLAGQSMVVVVVLAEQLRVEECWESL